MFAVAVAVVVIAVGAVVVAPLVVVVVVIIVVVVRIVGVLGIFVTSVAGAVVVVVVVAAVLAGPVVDVVVVGDGRLLSSIPGGVNRVTNPPLFRRGPRLGTPRQHPFVLEGGLTVPGHFKCPKGPVSRRNATFDDERRDHNGHVPTTKVRMLTTMDAAVTA